eukprot:gene29874-37000_t
MEFRYFLPSPFLTDVVGVNDFVIVDSEKGEDLGIIVQFITFAHFKREEQSAEKQKSNSEESPVIRHVKRLASELELALLPEKYQDELVVISHANQIIVNEMNSSVQVINAEYTFDRKKLFLYYQMNSKKVNFKDMVGKMYNIFRTCIWLKKFDQSVMIFQSSCAPHNVLALRTGHLKLPPPPPPRFQERQRNAFPASEMRHGYVRSSDGEQQYYEQHSYQPQPQAQVSVYQPPMTVTDLGVGTFSGIVNTAAGGIETYRARADSDEDGRRN